MQIQEALELFVVQLQADGRSDHTVAQYQRHVSKLAEWMTAKQLGANVADIRHEVLARFLASPEATSRGKKKQTSLNALRTSIKMFCRYLHDGGYTDRDHGRLIRRARATSAPPRWLTEREQEKLLGVLRRDDGGRDYVLFSVLLLAGLRISEALALTVDDVDLERDELRLRKTKNDSPCTTPISQDLQSILGGYLEVREGFLFSGPSGRPVTPRHARRRLKLWMKRAGLRPLPPHSLRHAFAMRLYKRVKDPFLVQAALRHRSIASTLVYCRPTVHALRTALQD